jgi:hypothetical protein
MSKTRLYKMMFVATAVLGLAAAFAGNTWS